MCNYAVDLAKSIINLEVQKQRVIEKDERQKRLCHCRKEILKTYLNTCQLLLIRTSSRVIKYVEDKSIDYAKIHDTEELKRWFHENAYVSMYNNPCISNKMIVVFNLIQSMLDDHFFTFFTEKYHELLTTINEWPLPFTDEAEIPMADLFEEMNEWFEASIFNIIAIKLDCNKIDDQIYDDFEIPHDEKCCPLKTEMGICESCVFVRNDLISNCRENHHAMETVGEDIHLYVVEQMLISKGWLLNFFGTIGRYHLDPVNINVVLDFSLIDPDQPYELTDDDKKDLEVIAKGFRSFQIINTQSVRGI